VHDSVAARLRQFESQMRGRAVTIRSTDDPDPEATAAQLDEIREGVERLRAERAAGEAR
jgi:hypothetical protein